MHGTFQNQNCNVTSLIMSLKFGTFVILHYVIDFINCTILGYAPSKQEHLTLLLTKSEQSKIKIQLSSN